MARFRRKPTEVEAEQFLDKDNPPSGVYKSAAFPTHVVKTLQGVETPVAVGEWIVKETSGPGHYPVADVEFRRIYEPTTMAADFALGPKRER